VTTHYAPPLVRLKHRTLVLKVRPRSSLAERQGLVEKWYRDLLRQEAEVAIERWSARLGVSPRRLFVQRMKTKWGSCNPKTGYVRFNTDLAKKPRECLDYVVLHELAHLIERTHSDGFFDILDRNMPQWREVRRLLNDLPVSTPPV
jgi:predicted metal-dependent hydrolase